jgi:DNA-binding NarL/FixJ family response regulator
MIRVMLVSEHAAERSRLAGILGQWPDFQILSKGRDSYDALYLARSFLPHVALVDEEPSLLDCPGLVSALRRCSPRTRTVVLASSPESRPVLSAIAAGAAGYLLKGRDADLVPAVIWVHGGGALMAREVASRAFTAAGGKKPASPLKKLDVTRAELELLTRIGRGLPDKEIAAELRLKNGTVRNYVSALLRKTGLRSRTEVALFVHHAGILGDEWKPESPGLFPPPPAGK